jgi:predicted AAA+ superfamily ATPase
LDEVQNIDVFQRLVDGLFIKKNVDLYITGSNAYLLSGELATLLTGRYIPAEILPFSFAEYMAMKKSLDLQKPASLTAEDKTDESANFLKLLKKGNYSGGAKSQR